MPSRGSNVAPISHWRDAEAQIARAEIQAQVGEPCVIDLPRSVFFDTLTVSGKVGAFRYVAHYREGWPGNGRKPKSMDQHEAIALLCELAQVAENRAQAAEWEAVTAAPLTPELEMLYARVVNERPLPHGRSF